MSENITCGCDDPDIYSRHCYEGMTLQKAYGSCKNCKVRFNYNLKTKKWEKSE